MKLINTDELWKAFISADKDDIYSLADIEEIIESINYIDLIPCIECKQVKEVGGHANCAGWLICKRTGKNVNEDDYCSKEKRV